MNIPKSLIIFFIIAFASFFVHELGHAFVGLLVGANVIGFEFGILAFKVWIVDYDLVFDPLIRLSGGLIQGLFLLIVGPRIVPSYSLEFKVLAVAFMVYGLLESGLII